MNYLKTITWALLATCLTIPLLADPNRSRFLDRPEIVENLPEDLQEMIGEFRANQAELREEMKALIGELDNPTKEEIESIRTQFREDNADRIAAQKELSSAIRKRVKELREDGTLPARGSRSGKDDSKRLDDARNHFKEKRAAFMERRQELKERLQNATSEEEKKEIIQEFRAEMKAQRQEMKEERRKKRKERREQRAQENESN